MTQCHLGIILAWNTERISNYGETSDKPEMASVLFKRKKQDSIL